MATRKDGIQPLTSLSCTLSLQCKPWWCLWAATWCHPTVPSCTLGISLMLFWTVVLSCHNVKGQISKALTLQSVAILKATEMWNAPFSISSALFYDKMQWFQLLLCQHSLQKRNRKFWSQKEKALLVTTCGKISRKKNNIMHFISILNPLHSKSKVVGDRCVQNTLRWGRKNQ